MELNIDVEHMDRQVGENCSLVKENIERKCPFAHIDEEFAIIRDLASIDNGLIRTLVEKSFVRAYIYYLVENPNIDQTKELINGLIDRNLIENIEISLYVKLFSCINVDLPNELINLLSQNGNSTVETFPTHLRSNIWSKRPSLFGDMIVPLLREYSNEFDGCLETFNHKEFHSFMQMEIKQRRVRQVTQFNQLICWIGNSVFLYNLTLQFIRTLWLKSGQSNYCSLRYDLLMSFHDSDIIIIKNADLCHKFNWCLDACLKVGHSNSTIHEKYLKEFSDIIDALVKEDRQIYSEIGFILSDCYCRKFINNSIASQIFICIEQLILPQDNEQLFLLLKISYLAQSGYFMLRNNSIMDIEISDAIIKVIIPLLGSIIISSSNQLDLNDPSTLKLIEKLKDGVTFDLKALNFQPIDITVCGSFLFYLIIACINKKLWKCVIELLTFLLRLCILFKELVDYQQWIINSDECFYSTNYDCATLTFNIYEICDQMIKMMKFEEFCSYFNEFLGLFKDILQIFPNQPYLFHLLRLFHSLYQNTSLNNQPNSFLLLKKLFIDHQESFKTNENLVSIFDQISTKFCS